MDKKELLNNIKNRQNLIQGQEFKLHLEPCDECKKRGNKNPIIKKENKIKFI
jgi:hypothetical protein